MESVAKRVDVLQEISRQSSAKFINAVAKDWKNAVCETNRGGGRSEK